MPGQTDMVACMRAYRDIDFKGVLRPDHVPTMAGDDNENAGYSSIGRLFAIGYLKGIREVGIRRKRRSALDRHGHGHVFDILFSG